MNPDRVLGLQTNNSRHNFYGKKVISSINILKSSNYNNNFKFQFDESLKGINTYQSLLQSNATFLEPERFTNFTSLHNWKDFLFEPHTTRLFETKGYNLS